jgi:hypothetical protein
MYATACRSPTSIAGRLRRAARSRAGCTAGAPGHRTGDMSDVRPAIGPVDRLTIHPRTQTCSGSTWGTSPPDVRARALAHRRVRPPLSRDHPRDGHRHGVLRRQFRGLPATGRMHPSPVALATSALPHSATWPGAETPKRHRDGRLAKAHNRPACRSISAGPLPFRRVSLHNRVSVAGKQYTYPRYMFVNESGDIMRFCQGALDRLGISWRMTRRNTPSVARREAVAALDEHVGPTS